MNPIVVRELRGGLRSGRRIALMTFFLTIVAVAFLSVYAATTAALSATGSSSGAGIGAVFFPLTIGVELLFLCLLTPAQTAGALVGERERQTYDVLLSTPLTPWQVTTGKLAANIGFTALLLVAALPIQSLAFLMGGVGPEELLLAALLLLATLLCFGSLGLWASTLFRGSRAAVAFAYALSGALSLGLPFLAAFTAPISIAVASAAPNLAAAPPPWLIYVGELLAATNPWITAGLTEAQLRGGLPLFWLHQVFGKTHVDVPGPWLIFLALYALASWLFLWLTARSVRTHRAA